MKASLQVAPNRSNLLIDAMTRLLPEEGELETVIPNLRLYRHDSPTEITCQIYEPALAFVVQGQKQAVIGEKTFTYGEAQWLLTPLNVPAISKVLRASPKTPYLAVALFFDLAAARKIAAEDGLLDNTSQAGGPAVSSGQVTSDLSDAIFRLVTLLGSPEHIPVLGRLIQHEILYRLLISSEGAMLRQIVTTGSQGQRIARATEWLRVNFRQTLKISELARHVRMGTSTLHHHFRAFTGMSPIQYQKQLRLFEGRRLMLLEGSDVGSAAYATGYESLTQFTREYRRQFGRPPMRDIRALRMASPTHHKVRIA